MPYPVERLQVRTAPDRISGAMWGGSAGAVLGALVGVNAASDNDSDAFYPSGPFYGVFGGLIGWLARRGRGVAAGAAQMGARAGPRAPALTWDYA